MKTIFPLLAIIVLIQSCASNESVLLLKPSQSMCITGKGPGQDAAINPYGDTNSIAVIKNTGDNDLDARVQESGKIVAIITVKPTEIREISLEKGAELYLDSQFESEARLHFKADRKMP